MVLAPTLTIWYDGDDFMRRVGLPILFAFGAVPILFSAAFGLGLVEMPSPVKIFGISCKKCGQQS